jgi:hypothetical protein
MPRGDERDSEHRIPGLRLAPFHKNVNRWVAHGTTGLAEPQRRGPESLDGIVEERISDGVVFPGAAIELQDGVDILVKESRGKLPSGGCGRDHK